MAEPTQPPQTPVTIKKYANRRLYNTATSSYVTLDHLCQMVKDNVDFVVYDAKSGEDITRSVLTQIIVEEEGKGQSLLPINFLRQVISFYGDNLQVLLPRYLDQSMELFGRNQEQMRAYMKETFGGMFPFARFEEMGKQNLALFERAMTMFTPFKPEAKVAEAAAGNGKEVQLDAVRHQVEALQRQLETLTRQIGEKNPK
jgi:polyhydroxyalkanoate synthesis repressor PhaR